MLIKRFDTIGQRQRIKMVLRSDALHRLIEEGQSSRRQVEENRITESKRIIREWWNGGK